MHGSSKSIVIVYIVYGLPFSPSKSLDLLDRFCSSQLTYCGSHIPGFIFQFMTVMGEHLQVGIRKEDSSIGGSGFLKNDSRTGQE